MDKILGRLPTQAKLFRRIHIKKRRMSQIWMCGLSQGLKKPIMIMHGTYLSSSRLSKWWVGRLSLHRKTQKVAGRRQKGKVYGLGSRNDLCHIQSRLQGIGSSR